MIAGLVRNAGVSTRTSLELLQRVFGEAYARDFSIALWDGTRVPATGSERFTFVVTDPGGLRAAFAQPIDLCPGRAFVAGLIGIEGDLEAAVDALYLATARLRARTLVEIGLLLQRLPKPSLPNLREARMSGRPHTIERDRDAIAFHYDLPVAFYQTFLDRALVYSCAYYDRGVESLDDAQSAKCDYLLRKLRLARGERLLDIGCGWGGLVIRAAAVGVRALGITLSKTQYEEARRRIAAAGLEDLASVELLDYRELGDRRFDKIVSVGMFEHVGKARLAEYFRCAFDALEPGGLFLNHGIANQHDGSRSGKANGFIERFIFPDGELTAISEALRVAEDAGFEVRDVENLREHYTRTLRAWVDNIERNAGAAEAVAGAQSVRAWRLYLAGSAQGFRVGRLGLFQSLLAKRDDEGGVRIPSTRRDIYAPGTGG